MSVKGFNFDGTVQKYDYDHLDNKIEKTTLAPEFIPAKAYLAGDMVFYEGKLYSRKTDGTDQSWILSNWTETDIEERLTAVEEDVSGLKGDLEEEIEGTRVYSYNGLDWDGLVKAKISGSETQHAAYKLSNFIRVIEDSQIVYDGLRSASASYCIIAAYDENKNYNSEYSVAGSGGADSGTYTVPAGVSYIRVSTFDYNGELYFVSIAVPYKETISKLDELTDDFSAVQTRLGQAEDDLDRAEIRITNLESQSIIQYTDNDFDNYDINIPGGIKKDGSDWDYQYSVRSDYISTENIVEITVHIKGVNNYEAVLAAYDANQNPIPTKLIKSYDPEGGSGSWVYGDGTIVIGDDVKYIRITRSISASNNAGDTISVVKNRTFSADYTEIKETVKGLSEDLEEIETPWKGKKWYAFGTSLTDSTYLDPNGDPTGKYPGFLNEHLQAVLVNKGKGGGGITSHSNGSILTAIRNTDFSDADLVTLEGFPNDYSAAPGIYTDTTADTLCGALYLALTEIYTKAPNATVVLITASQGKLNTAGTAGYPIDFTSATGNKQVEYNQAIIKMGQYFGCHVIDAGGKSQINNYHPNYLVDHIHHSWLGGKQFAETIWEELKYIHCNTDVSVN